MPGSKYPYTASAGPLVATIEQFRKAFPSTVTAETLQKLGLAPKNESYVLNTLRFLGLIGEDDAKNDDAAAVFLEGDTDAFAHGIEKLVRDAYNGLFALHGDSAWNLDKNQLTTFFRKTDGSTDTVGQRQAGTFITLAGLAGKRELPERRPRGNGSVAKNNGTPKKRTSDTASEDSAKGLAAGSGSGNGKSSLGRDFGLSVRIEVNLPAVDDQGVYDKIFRSIRENLINAN